MVHETIYFHGLSLTYKFLREILQVALVRKFTASFRQKLPRHTQTWCSADFKCIGSCMFPSPALSPEWRLGLTDGDGPDHGDLQHGLGAWVEAAVLDGAADAHVSIQGDGAQVHDGGRGEEHVQVDPDGAQGIRQRPDIIWQGGAVGWGWQKDY